MSKLEEQIQQHLKEAMIAKDSTALATLRALKTAFMNAAIEKGGRGTELAASELISIIRKQVKQRQDSATEFDAANRPELAENERAQIAVLERYLPAALKPEELVKFVEEAIAELGASTKADMGKVIKLLKEKTEGRADGKTLAQEVAKRLS